MAAFTVVNTSDDASQGSLRWAIQQVNAGTSPATIQFNIPGSGVEKIVLKSALPAITNQVVIDGTTQHDFSGPLLIQLDGSQAGSNTSGLVLAAGGSVVRGLVISGFLAQGSCWRAVPARSSSRMKWAPILPARPPTPMAPGF